ARSTERSVSKGAVRPLAAAPTAAARPRWASTRSASRRRRRRRAPFCTRRSRTDRGGGIFVAIARRVAHDARMRLAVLGLVGLVAGILPSCAPPRAPAAASVPPAATGSEKPVETAGAHDLGEIDFPVSGSAACQRGFQSGMLALHSFF